MPKVGKKEFSYTKAGYAAARKEAKKTGQKMVSPKKSSSPVTSAVKKAQASVKAKKRVSQTRRNNMDY